MVREHITQTNNKSCNTIIYIVSIYIYRNYTIDENIAFRFT